MLFYYNFIIFLYLFCRSVIPLEVPIIVKVIISVFLLFGTQLHFVSKKTTGLMVGEYPKWLLYPWEFFFASSFILFLTTVFLDIIRIISIPFSVLHIALMSNKTIEYSIIFSLIVAGFSLAQGTRVPKIKEKNIYIKNWPKKLTNYKIIQLTDLHISSLLSKKWLKKVVDKVNKENADLIVITGDFIDGFPENHADSIKPLSLLKSKSGVYGVTGNHDYYYGFKNWTEEFKKNGVKLLFNEHVLLEESFYLIGVPFLVAEKHNQEAPNIQKATHGRKTEIPSILLDHRPSTALENQKYNIDLQLSGHTHGGMIPLLATVVKKKNNGFYSGLYQLSNMQLYLSNGTGIWNGFPIRIGYNSEITMLKINTKE